MKVKFFTADDLITDKLFKRISAKHIVGHDVTIVPKSRRYHYFTISSVTSLKLRGLARLGFPYAGRNDQGKLAQQAHSACCWSW
ncbi:Uncharacterized protein PFLU_1481 [Pseudomonas [fluorescens] SBW25]|uniref:Uncharacterized protein n=1 Tax=Pseudomonas fluorescens (strain SBW25) TaxID=216595 RepID=C3K4R3_PSEFS|nr:Uncharacterized protein PFLU_1481 [Pseudomonas fluorescens SBW25]